MSEPSTDSASPFTFNILEAPIEIRRLIYDFVLPIQDTPRRDNKSWATIENVPNTSMGLLRANRQISQEALDVLYGSNAFTIFIHPHSAVCFQWSRLETFSFKQFDPPYPISRIQKWQINLGFNPYYRMFTSARDYVNADNHLNLPADINRDSSCTRDVVRSIADELIKCPNLKSLKVRIPCVCYRHRDNAAGIAEIAEAVRSSISPLGRLAFNGSITFITATSTDIVGRSWVQWQDLGSGPSQCRQPACLGLAADLKSFLKTLVCPSSPRLQLSSYEREWLDLKRRIPNSCYQHSSVALFSVIIAIENGTPELIAQRMTAAKLAIANNTNLEQAMTNRLRALPRDLQIPLYLEAWYVATVFPGGSDYPPSES